jgi:hypothetical protein
MSIFIPTFLYIKQHTITGKLYFGKTTKNPEKYLGSGRYWTKHIEKHGKEHVVNLWYCLFYDEEDCTKFALEFSNNHHIVESDDWANLMLENGATGGAVKNNHLKIYNKTRSHEYNVKMAEYMNKNGKNVQWKNPTKRNLAISDSLKNKPFVTCPHCGKSAKLLGAFMSHHFDKCKEKQVSD